jgi:hypothetical protein
MLVSVDIRQTLSTHPTKNVRREWVVSLFGRLGIIFHHNYINCSVIDMTLHHDMLCSVMSINLYISLYIYIYVYIYIYPCLYVPMYLSMLTLFISSSTTTATTTTTTSVALLSFGYMVPWVTIGSLIQYFTDKYGNSYFVVLNVAFYAVGYPVSYIQRRVDLYYDTVYGSKRTFRRRIEICMVALVAICLTLPALNGALYIVAVTVIGVFTWTCHGSSSALASVVKHNSNVVQQIGFALPGVFALIMNACFHLDIDTNKKRVLLFYAITAGFVCIGLIAWVRGTGCVLICIYLSIYLCTCLYIHLSTYLHIYLSTYPSTHPSTHFSIHPSIYLSIYLSNVKFPVRTLAVTAVDPRQVRCGQTPPRRKGRKVRA